MPIGSQRECRDLVICDLADAISDIFRDFSGNLLRWRRGWMAGLSGRIDGVPIFAGFVDRRQLASHS